MEELRGMRKTKVLIINTNPTCCDGIMSAIFNYVENMDKTDIMIDFVAINMADDSIKQRIERIGLRLYVLPFRIKKPFKYGIQLFRLFKREHYTISHIHGSSCIMAVEMIVAKLARVPALPHSHSTNCQHKKIHKLLRPLFNLLYKNGFACSTEAGHWLYGERHFEVINNGISLEKFSFDGVKREEFRKVLGLSENDIGIIHVAHFTEVKNHAFLIRTFKGVVEWEGRASEGKYFKLFLLGEGKTKKDIVKLVNEYGLCDHVIFVGVTQKVSQYLCACDLMVLPSYYEGFPFAAIEAQATGIRCLVSDKVTRSCCFSEEFKYIPLSEMVWINEILKSGNDYDRMKLCLKNQKNIIDNGYDIKTSAEKLKRFYIDFGKQL